MKKIILILTLFAIPNLYAQDSISYKDASINTNEIIGNSVQNITSIFGSPNSIVDYIYETDDIKTKKYIYNGLNLYVYNNKVVDFEIISSSYSFTKNNVKVGALVSTIENYYPYSYRKRKNNALTIRFKDIDKFITVSYDSSLKIKEIRTGSY